MHISCLTSQGVDLKGCTGVSLAVSPAGYYAAFSDRAREMLRIRRFLVYINMIYIQNYIHASSSSYRTRFAILVVIISVRYGYAGTVRNQQMSLNMGNLNCRVSRCGRDSCILTRQ